MSWGKLDDSMAFHRKVLAAGNEAVGAWARMISQSCCELTDGRIARATALAIASPKTLKRLVDVGLLEQLTDGDFQIHDFLDWNPTGAEVKERRETDRVRKEEARRRQGRDSQGRMTSARSPEIVPSDVRSDVRADSAKNPEGVTPLPSRPVPSRPNPKEDPPKPPASDSNEDWGLEPERESAVQPIAEVPSEQRYQQAYESGAEAGLGRPFGLPEKQRGELHQAIAKHARDADGRALRGELLLDWIRWHAEQFTRWVNAKPADEQRFWSGFGPRGMFRWLNEVPVNQQPEPEPMARRRASEPVAAGALFAPRGVSRG